MAENQGEEYTSNSQSRSSHRPVSPWVTRYWFTFSTATVRWGSSEPGIAATASRKSKISAVRMLVSCRHERRNTYSIYSSTSPTPTVARSQLTSSSQAPVTSATPTATSRAPPIRVTQTLLRRIAAKTPSRQRNPSPKATNGAPSPRQYAMASTTARPVEPPTAASPSTAPSVGPTHGTHDSAKTAPNTGAPNSPAAGSVWMRHSRCRLGTRPRNATPSTMTSAPTTTSTVRPCRSSARPNAAATTLVEMNTMANPARSEE